MESLKANISMLYIGHFTQKESAVTVRNYSMTCF